MAEKLDRIAQIRWEHERAASYDPEFHAITPIGVLLAEIDRLTAERDRAVRTLTVLTGVDPVEILADLRETLAEEACRVETRESPADSPSGELPGPLPEATAPGSPIMPPEET